MGEQFLKNFPLTATALSSNHEEQNLHALFKNIILFQVQFQQY